MGDAKSELSLTHREALDRLADEFERELRCANAPKIEDFIDREPAIRKQLLPELVAIEIELREYVGEQPIDEHYRNRFPNDWQQLQDLFVDRRRTATATIGVQPLVRVFGRQESSVLRSLQRTLPTIPRVMLKAAEQESATPIVRTKSTEMPRIELDLDGRYRIDGEIARGGMGAILKGRDTDLGRDLAIKVLLGSHQDDPAIIRRFIEEAQIGGQLQHPGIVPVYELGQFADRRPFISMKLVKGKTLAVGW